MAAISPTVGIPTTQAGNLPNDYSSVRASPQDFGAQVGQAVEGVGQGLSKTGQFFGEVAADNASNDFQAEATKLLHGDPNKTTIGPDGQPVQDTGYLGLKGRAALDARPQLQQQLDDLTKNIRGKLYTPEQQLQFDNYSRRYRSFMDGQIGTHADSQANVWYGEVNKASGDLAVNHIANNADNDDEYLHGREDLRKAYVKQVQLIGGGPELVNNAIRKADQTAVIARARSLGVNNPLAAQKFIDSNKDAAGDQYDNLSASFRTRVNEATGVQAADRAVQEAAASHVPVPAQDNAVPPVTKAILDQELSDRVSINGAVGPAQILPDTFARYAKPGEDINNPNDNRAVAQRIIADYSQKYNGDPDRVAVAYFSGEGNVAPAGSPTPWIRNTQDGNGKSVSSYVSDIQNRTSGQAPVASLKANAYQRAMELTKDNPEAQRVALARINQQYTAAQVAADMTAAQRKQSSDQSANNYMSMILDRKATSDTVHAIAQDPNLEWKTKQDLQKALLENMSDPDKAARTYGSGFWDAYKNVTASEGDPKRIADISTLLGHAGPDGDLTLSGIQKLNQVMTEIRTPEGARKNELTKSLFAVANQKISQKPEGVTFGGDPDAKNQFAKFQNVALAQIDKDISSGKSLQEVFDPDSKTGVYSLIKNYVRPRDQWTGNAVNKPDLDTFAGIYQAVQGGQMTQEDGVAMAIQKGLIRPNAPQPPTD